MKDLIKINLPDIETTKNIASMIAKKAQRGFFLSLKGELGSGKTTFTKFFINSLSNENILVSSPTFPLVNIYELSSKRVWHYDLYRLNNRSELFALDFDLAIQDIVIMEWPEIVEDLIPNDRMEIKFQEDSDSNLFIVIKIIGNPSLESDLNFDGKINQ